MGWGDGSAYNQMAQFMPNGMPHPGMGPFQPSMGMFSIHRLLITSQPVPNTWICRNARNGDGPDGREPRCFWRLSDGDEWHE